MNSWKIRVRGIVVHFSRNFSVNAAERGCKIRVTRANFVGALGNLHEFYLLVDDASTSLSSYRRSTRNP